jgi:hypothetical protein
MEQAQANAKKKRIPDILTPVDEKIIQTVYKYHLVTVEQVTRALYSKGSITTVRARLAHLAALHYLLSFNLPTPRGKRPKIYTIARPGLNHLKTLGVDVNPRFRPNEIADLEKNLPYLKHTLAVNDVLIAAANLEKHDPSITLYDMRHERFLKQEPDKYPIAIYDEEGKLLRTEYYTLVPDGFLDFHIKDEERDKTYRRCILLEVDRGTEERKQFKRKIRGLLTFVKSGMYTKKYHSRKVTIAFATTRGSQRVEKMQEWTRSELAKTKEPPEISHMFVFTALPHAIDETTNDELEALALDPETLFLSPTWVVPFQKNRPPMTLLGADNL